MSVRVFVIKKLSPQGKALLDGLRARKTERKAESLKLLADMHGKFDHLYKSK